VLFVVRYGSFAVGATLSVRIEEEQAHLENRILVLPSPLAVVVPMGDSRGTVKAVPADDAVRMVEVVAR
jgi:hypothetical protein